MSAPFLLRSPSLHTEAAGPAPDAFGSFRVLHQIGAGTLGPVFRGYDPERERLVAIKLFKLDLAPERVHQLIAQLEQIIATNLPHPALVAPIAAGIADVSVFLATDYVAADSLDLSIREHGAAAPAQALSAATTLAAALDSAAGSGVLHGAMHPRDVLLSDDAVRLTGIGIARALETIGVSAPVRRPYTAPERIAGTEWDRRADVFSLAALTYELLSGRRVAGTGDRAGEAIGEIKGGNATGLKRVFGRALDDDPANRFDTATEFVEALKTALPGVRTPSTPAKRRPIRREIDPRLPLDVRVSSPETPDTFDLDTADLRAAEEQRFVDVEIAPSLPAETIPLVADQADDRGHDLFDSPASIPDTPTSPPAGLITPGPDPLTVLDRSRSAIWPLALALMLGIVLGFAAGFGFSVGVPSTSRSDATSSAPPPAAAAGREFTEGTVPAASPKPAPAPEAPPKRDVAKTPAVPRPDLIGRLLIRSTPAGARVFVDDRDVGRTPAAVRDVAVGAHRVRVVHEGYATEERSLTISRKRPTVAMTVGLKRPAAARNANAAPTAASKTTAGIGGALVVDSRPTGAKVFLDGKLVGTTPMSLPSVTAGEHAIRLERDGYRNWSSTVRVSGPGQQRVTASLER
jgi:eukaryotic-like serine/threonine-protein kinase